MYVEIHSRNDYEPESRGQTRRVSAGDIEVRPRDGLLTVRAVEWVLYGSGAADFIGRSEKHYERTAVLELQPQDLAKIFNAALAAGLITVSATPRASA